MKVEIYSDIVCPWCYIGERRFARALESFEDSESVEVVYRPYQLDPAAPDDPIPLADYLERRFGPRGRGMQERIGAMAAEEGISIDWGRAIAANTRTAHRLLRLAGLEYGADTQRRLAARLFDFHFSRGGDLSSIEQLTAEAVAAGLEEQRVSAYLQSGEGADELEQEFDQARQLGIQAVPTFVFQGRWAVQGAQSSETFVNALREAGEEIPG